MEVQGAGTFSWGSEEDGPAEPSSRKCEESDDMSDISDDEDFEMDRPTRLRSPPLWLKDYVQILGFRFIRDIKLYL